MIQSHTSPDRQHVMLLSAGAVLRARTRTAPHRILAGNAPITERWMLDVARICQKDFVCRTLITVTFHLNTPVFF